MLNFKKIEIEDRDWVNEILRRSERVSLEYNFTTMFIWGDIYNTEIAERDGVLLCSSGEDDKQFLFPIGEDFAGVLRELDEYTNGRMSFYALTKTQWRRYIRDAFLFVRTETRRIIYIKLKR